MKVTGKSPLDPKVLQGTSNVKTSASKPESAASKQAAEAGAAAGAKVSLSARARDYQKIKEVADNSDGVDAAKVERIKKALKEGKFDVDYDKVAEKIVENDIMYDLLS